MEGKVHGRRVKIDLLPLSPTFLFPRPPSAFTKAPFPSAPFPTAPKASRQGLHIRQTLAWLPELGMLKRPAPAFSSLQLWQLSHPHPEGAGPHSPSMRGSTREDIHPLPRRKRGANASWPVRGSGPLPGARGGEGAGSGPRGRAAPSGARARERAGSGRGAVAGAGPRRRADAQLGGFWRLRRGRGGRR